MSRRRGSLLALNILKDWQRHFLKSEDRPLSNAKALGRPILLHRTPH